jgi:hypothetical protein
MDDRSLIHTEIDRLNDEQLAEVAAQIREIKGRSPSVASENLKSNPERGVQTQQGLLAQLMEIEIDAPANLSETILRARHGDFGGE